MNGRRLLILLSAASFASFCGCATYPAGSYTGASASADIGVYDGLSRYGTWEDVAPYGECWVPLDVPTGWRPYTEGYWVDTDYGFMWISQDPWGGIPCHYGRWAENDAYGWLWIPDDDMVWAPAWVSWRYGDGYVGWAPLPPDVGWQGQTGLTVSATVLDQRISGDSWCFAPARDFGTARIRASELPPGRNLTLISRTENVTRYDVVNSRPAERGMSPEILERDTGRKFQRYQVLDSSSPASMRGDRIRGLTIEAYRPSDTASRIRPVRPTGSTQSAPPPAVVKRLDQEQRQFDRRMQQERAALDREQQRELRQQNQTQAQEKIRQRHQAEMQAQQVREDRERRALDRRRQIAQDMKNHQGSGKDQKQGKGHGKDRGKSQDKGQAKGNGQENNPDQGKDHDRNRGDSGADPAPE